uniref:Uncharacterized protein n=1 Tax=Romanomermis culicivorax TaxID=13658 RepID=A0A915IHN0_ROMCU
MPVARSAARVGRNIFVPPAVLHQQSQQGTSIQISIQRHSEASPSSTAAPSAVDDASNVDKVKTSSLAVPSMFPLLLLNSRRKSGESMHSSAGNKSPAKSSLTPKFTPSPGGSLSKARMKFMDDSSDDEARASFQSEISNPVVARLAVGALGYGKLEGSHLLSKKRVKP